MIDSKTAPYAALVLGVSLGAMFLAHSVYLKAFVFTLPGTAQFFASIGLPAILAYLVFIAEAAGGVLLIAGLYARGVALALIPILIGAAYGGEVAKIVPVDHMQLCKHNLPNLLIVLQQRKI